MHGQRMWNNVATMSNSKDDRFSGEANKLIKKIQCFCVEIRGSLLW
jgi:hypothetical protein